VERVDTPREAVAVPTVVRNDTFTRLLKDLDKPKRATAEKKIGYIQADPRDPRLRTKKLAACKANHYEAKLNGGDRIIFQWIGLDVALLFIGTHKQAETWIKVNC
jgi:mRNA-degrading endonuclease RelE of RelBE toxin-antitoxin system